MKFASFLCLALASGFGATAVPAAPRALRLEKAVMIVRHGVRAPLDGEAPVQAATGEAWPAWPVAQSRLTPHGAEGMRLLGAYFRAHYAQGGLLARTGCPAAGAVRIWTNVSARTIASGEALAQGLAPGCAVPAGRLPPGAVDPIFNPLEAGASPFDGAEAVAAIEAHNGGIVRLAAAHRREIALLEDVLGCRRGSAAADCRLMDVPARLAPSADGKGLDLTGPIIATSGTAQVLLIEYAEGLPMAQVGWGRADAATIERLGVLHTLLFDVHARPPYMAARQAAVLGRRMVASLERAGGPRLDLLVGHDSNVNGLAAVLDVHFKIDGYARDDAALGGALILERLRDRADGRLYVRVRYLAQTLDQLRALAPLTLDRPPASIVLRVAGCALPGADLCRLEDFTRLVRGRLAPLAIQPGRDMR